MNFEMNIQSWNIERYRTHYLDAACEIIFWQLIFYLITITVNLLPYSDIEMFISIFFKHYLSIIYWNGILFLLQGLKSTL